MGIRVELSQDDDMFDQRRRKSLFVRVGGSEWNSQDNDDKTNEGSDGSHGALTLNNSRYHCTPLVAGFEDLRELFPFGHERSQIAAALGQKFGLTLGFGGADKRLQ